MTEIEKIISVIDDDPSIMHVDRDGFSLSTKLFDIIEKSDDADLIHQAILAFEKICDANAETPNMPGMFSSKLSYMGMKAYSEKDLLTAEVSFKLLSRVNDQNGKNNYAYMIRRHETMEHITNVPVKVLSLLRQGITNSEPFSMVNAALTLSLLCQKDEDWRLADDIISSLPKFGGIQVESWWEDVAKANDIEGYLVHFLLLRNKKISNSPLGSIVYLSKKLSQNVLGFPSWMHDSLAFRQLSDVFECVEDEEFDDYLNDYLNQMPMTRESVDEIINETRTWDNLTLYTSLLTRFQPMLTPGEYEQIVQDYKRIFSLPLPFSGSSDSAQEE